MSSNQNYETEYFPSPANLPPGKTFRGKIRFFLRRLADLQVASVLQQLLPWLSGISGKVLEVGCGAQPYRHFIPSSCEYQGLDWEGASKYFSYKIPDTIYYSGEDFPFEDNHFDALFHTEVLEHIYHKEQFLHECYRVLKPASQMFFTVPFQARNHYKPFDFWRFTPAAIERMLREAGFEEIVIASRGNDITVASYKNVSLTYRWLQGNLFEKFLGLITLPFALLFLLIGHFSLWLRIGSSDDALGYIVTARAR